MLLGTANKIFITVARREQTQVSVHHPCTLLITRVARGLLVKPLT